MKWFDKWFLHKSKWAWDNKHMLDVGSVITSEARLIEDDPHDLSDGLRISVKKVIGGSLVTFKHYDKKLDRSDNKTYIITSDQDFTTELGKIISIESLRQL